MIMIYIDLIMKVIFLDIDGVLNTSGDENLIEGTFEIYKLN